ncbi:MAG TPA: hypothetical protein VHX37_04635 [Acidobacteriaceae bacterium]|nr:hypothetical protein [Acidobacteriaceae bacterium]
MRARLSPSHVGWARWLGIFCIALVLMSGVIQAAHFHANGQVDPDCSLCLAAHQIAHVAAPITLHLTSLRVAAVIVPRTLTRPRPALAFRLISRPPPSPGVSLT